MLRFCPRGFPVWSTCENYGFEIVTCGTCFCGMLRGVPRNSKKKDCLVCLVFQ